MGAHIVQGLKRALLPSGAHPRTLPAGIGRGNVRIELDFAHHTRQYIGLFEIEINRWLRRFLRPGVRSFDVGGYQGYDALLFAKLTGAPVATFEIDQDALAGMRRSFALDPALAPLITPVGGAVGCSGDAIRLDDYAAEHFAPGFVKIDVDGAEFDVLRGASLLLRKHRPAIVLEVHSRELERDCGRLLVEHGYLPTIVNQRQVLRERRPIEHNRWLVAS